MSEMTELCETEPEPQSIIERMRLVTNPTEEMPVINIPRRGTQRR